MKKQCVLFTLLFGWAAIIQGQVYNNGDLYVQNGALLTVEGTLTNTAIALLQNNGILRIAGSITNDAVLTAYPSASWILYGSTSQVINGSQPLSLTHLQVDNSNGVLLGQQVTVSGTLTFVNGRVLAADPVFPLLFNGAAATVAGQTATRHIQGWVAIQNKTSFVFPIGNGSRLKPLLLQNIQLPTAPIKVSYGGTSNKVVNGTQYSGDLVDISNNWWDIEALGNRADLTLYSEEVNDYGMANQLPLLRVANKGAITWGAVPTTVAGTLTNGTVSTSAVTQFGRFALGISAVVLPIELVEFSGVQQPGRTLLRWQVAGDDEVDYYSVERQAKAGQWTALHKQEGRQSHLTELYTYTDLQPLEGPNYYRLRITAKNGRTTYSSILVFTHQGKDALQITPNLIADGWLVVRYQGRALNFPSAARILSPSGQVVKHFTLTGAQSRTDVRRLPAGAYQLEVWQQDQRMYTIPFLLTH